MRSINGVWFSAGFDDVLNLCLLQNDDLTAAKIEAALEGLKPEVTSLCQRVAQIRCFTAHDRLARAGKGVHAWVFIFVKIVVIRLRKFRQLFVRIVVSDNEEVATYEVTGLTVTTSVFWSEMAKQVLNLYESMEKLRREHETTSTVGQRAASSSLSFVIAQQVSSLRLPEDYALQDLRRLALNSFAQQLSVCGVTDWRGPRPTSAIFQRALSTQRCSCANASKASCWQRDVASLSKTCSEKQISHRFDRRNAWSAHVPAIAASMPLSRQTSPPVARAPSPERCACNVCWLMLYFCPTLFVVTVESAFPLSTASFLNARLLSSGHDCVKVFADCLLRSALLRSREAPACCWWLLRFTLSVSGLLW